MSDKPPGGFIKRAIGKVWKKKGKDDAAPPAAAATAPAVAVGAPGKSAPAIANASDHKSPAPATPASAPVAGSSSSGDVKTAAAGPVERVPLPAGVTSAAAAAAARLADPTAPLRILTLDGGGVRGQIEVLILQALDAAVTAVSDEHKCTRLPHLSDYFEFAYGTSTGGILAVALRYRLPLPVIAQLYETLPALIFNTEKWTLKNTMRSTLQALSIPVPVTFGPAPLEALLRHHFGGDSVTLGADGGHAPFAVIAVDQHSDGSKPVVLRNFDLTTTPPPAAAGSAAAAAPAKAAAVHWLSRLPVWKALRCTSAAPGYLPPVQVPAPPLASVTAAGGAERTLIDGGCGYNNPGDCVLHHLMGDIKRAGRRVVWVSIGTGEPPASAGGGGKLKSMGALASAIITGGQRVHNSVAKIMQTDAKADAAAAAAAADKHYARFQPPNTLTFPDPTQTKGAPVQVVVGGVDLACTNGKTLQAMRTRVAEWLATAPLQAQLRATASALLGMGVTQPVASAAASAAAPAPAPATVPVPVVVQA